MIGDLFHFGTASTPLILEGGARLPVPDRLRRNGFPGAQIALLMRRRPRSDDPAQPAGRKAQSRPGILAEEQVNAQ